MLWRKHIVWIQKNHKQLSFSNKKYKNHKSRIKCLSLSDIDHLISTRERESHFSHLFLHDYKHCRHFVIFFLSFDCIILLSMEMRRQRRRRKMSMNSIFGWNWNCLCTLNSTPTHRKKERK